MRIRTATPLLAFALVGAIACEADREVFEETGATLEPPEEIREAPITDTVGPERLEDVYRSGAPLSDTMPSPGDTIP